MLHEILFFIRSFITDWGMLIQTIGMLFFGFITLWLTIKYGENKSMINTLSKQLLLMSDLTKPHLTSVSPEFISVFASESSYQGGLINNGRTLYDLKVSENCHVNVKFNNQANVKSLAHKGTVNIDATFVSDIFGQPMQNSFNVTFKDADGFAYQQTLTKVNADLLQTSAPIPLSLSQTKNSANAKA